MVVPPLGLIVSAQLREWHWGSSHKAHMGFSSVAVSASSPEFHLDPAQGESLWPAGGLASALAVGDFSLCFVLTTMADCAFPFYISLISQLYQR